MNEKTVFAPMKVYLLLLAIVGCQGSLAASIPSLEEEIRWLQEERYVTTATKTREYISKSGATISVITSQDLKKMGARNLMDALKRLPGFGVNRFNMGTSSIEVRGVKTDFSEKVLFLIDGHSINNNLVNGGALSSYNNIRLHDIKVVEVIRGPGSALYGANAFSAVINIITMKAEDVSGLNFSLGVGSDQTKAASALFGSNDEVLRLAASFDLYETDGLDTYVASDALGRSGDIDHWQKRYEIGVRAELHQFNLHCRYVQRQSGAYLGANSTINDDSRQEYEDFFLEFSHKYSLNSVSELQSKLYFDQFRFNNLWEIFPEGFYDGFNTYPEGLLLRSPVKNAKLGADAQVSWNLGTDNKLLVGVALEKQKQWGVELWTNNGAGPLVDISDVANWNGDHERDIAALYLQDIWDVEDTLRLIVGVRFDYYDDFGGTINPRASFSWDATEKVQYIVTHGSAFRAPTFGELYNINNPSIVGNPSVEAEEIDTTELGVRFKFNNRTELKVTVFHNQIDNIIEPRASESAVNFSDNIGEKEVNGIETELTARLSDGSKVMFNSTYQDATNKLDDSRAVDIPLRRINLSYFYRHSRFLSAFAGVLHESSLNRASHDTRSDLPDVTTLDLALVWTHWKRDLSISASIYNALDEEVVEPSPAGVMLSDYPGAGRNFNLEIEFSLDAL